MVGFQNGIKIILVYSNLTIIKAYQFGANYTRQMENANMMQVLGSCVEDLSTANGSSDQLSQEACPNQNDILKINQQHLLIGSFNWIYKVCHISMMQQLQEL
ncbi:unnamed protein product [Paramecium sonneborni]|uniref:Uncharacterized protein n=1 Tax=Paramecium sonneborni TaxID=65129 RepID=A0A8S1RPX3_9CILI|nr:unnamed protein product [Paramecium sonneborni]